MAKCRKEQRKKGNDPEQRCVEYGRALNHCVAKRLCKPEAEEYGARGSAVWVLPRQLSRTATESWSQCLRASSARWERCPAGKAGGSSSEN